MTAPARLPAGARHPERPERPESSEHGRDPAEHDRPAAISGARTDLDVPAAVDRVLRDLLRARRAEALAADPTFAAHIAGRLSEFALGGGARRRSALVWWGWRACHGQDGGESPRAVLEVAAALELIQCCALVHDDVMDGSAIRRGRPAVHVDLAARVGA
ncbi:geranylgeranyl diphosphate synthase, type I, partial [Streptomyces sp. DvalAA-14]|uniref:polyprenyl synthetase family protein n=1 Tax=unclassified Streptomyces TaxID=2593676 RepID=UPI00081B6E63